MSACPSEAIAGRVSEGARGLAGPVGADGGGDA